MTPLLNLQRTRGFVLAQQVLVRTGVFSILTTDAALNCWCSNTVTAFLADFWYPDHTALGTPVKALR